MITLTPMKSYKYIIMREIDPYDKKQCIKELIINKTSFINNILYRFQ